MDNIIKTFLHEHRNTLNNLTSFMLNYNKKVNLTRIVEPDEIIEKHYIDSILPLILHNVPRGTITLDVGSGAGFPGVPVKIFRPDLDVTLLDSSRKRTDYLSALLGKIGVKCRVVTGRSEELSHNPDFRERYGLVISRAVANLAALCEYCLPFVEVGGMFLARKGEGSEVVSAMNACVLLGGEVQEIVEYELPSYEMANTIRPKRSLVVIKKVLQTPTKYPRRRINIVKNPIS